MREHGCVNVVMKRASFLMSDAELAQLAELDMGAAARAISPKTRVLTIHGTADGVTSVRDAAAYANAIATHRLALIQFAGHFFRRHTDDLVSAVLDWYAPTRVDAVSHQCERGVRHASRRPIESPFGRRRFGADDDATAIARTTTTGDAVADDDGSKAGGMLIRSSL